jgi:uncharacterized membrane protein YvlD (DUF360 family)
MLASLAVSAALLLALAAILPGFDVPSAGAALGFAVVVGLINALLWPLVVRVALPLTVLTLGVGALVLNGVVTLLAAAVMPGVELDGLGSAIVLWIALIAVATALSALLVLDDDARVLRPALKRARTGPRDPDAEPGVLFLEIDGLAHAVLQRALRDGNAPAMAPFGPRAARHVARTDGFVHCPDILVNSTWWPDTEEVAAFEELIGSHGGLGGPQTHPFVLVPASWPWPEDGVVGAEALHRVLRGWLARLGHDAYAEVVQP